MDKKQLLEHLIDLIDKDYCQYWEDDMVLGFSYPDLLEAKRLLEEMKESLN